MNAIRCKECNKMLSTTPHTFSYIDEVDQSVDIEIRCSRCKRENKILLERLQKSIAK